MGESGIGLLPVAARRRLAPVFPFHMLPGRAASFPAAPPQTRTSPIKAYGSSEARVTARGAICRWCWRTLNDDSGSSRVPIGSSVFRRFPWLLTGSIGSVRLLSIATMKPLRLPLLFSARSLRSLTDTLRLLALSLAPATRRLPVRQDVVLPVSPLLWLFAVGRRRISQVPREPLRPFALLSDPGRISTPGICCGVSMLPHLA